MFSPLPVSLPKFCANPLQTRSEFRLEPSRNGSIILALHAQVILRRNSVSFIMRVLVPFAMPQPFGSLIMAVAQVDGYRL